MKLTRRDAVAALGAVGVGTGAAGCTRDDPAAEAEPSPTATAEVEALGAVAEVLYPEDVDATDEFLETYVHGRATVDDAYLESVATAYEFVDAAAIDRRDEPFASLSSEGRDAVLRGAGLGNATPDPDAEEGLGHARYYLIDELLFALYSTPTGTERAGIRNPRGHPGGTETYQEAPE